MQGDIVAVYSETGTKLIAYTYDAWGNFSTTYYNGGASTAATYNPFRYRGYYYDTETGFYYLNSRYYDPAIGRFINPDDVSLLGANGDFASLNLYAHNSSKEFVMTSLFKSSVKNAIGTSIITVKNNFSCLIGRP